MWEDLPQDELKPGRYLYLEVCDSGCVISTDPLSRILDPFFTKFPNAAWGLRQ